MDRTKMVLGVSTGRLINLLVDDLAIFTKSTGGKAVFTPCDPVARMMVVNMLAVPPEKGGILISTLASLGPDQSEGGVGHVVKLNLATYVISSAGKPMDRVGDSAEMDFVSQAIKRILTFGFPPSYTGIIQGFSGYTPIDTSTVSTNQNLLCGRIDHFVYVALAGTSAYVCTSITDAGKASMIADGWRFSSLEQ